MAVSALTGGLKNLAHKFEHKVHTSVSSAASHVDSHSPDSVHLSKEALEGDAEDALKHHSFARFGQNVLNTLTPPPPYEKLNAQDHLAIQNGLQAGKGKTAPEQGLVDANGGHHEPIDLEVTGSQAQVEKALERQGWTPGYTVGDKPDVAGDLASGNLANLVPFSKQYAVNDRGQEVAPSFELSKGSDGLNRHHARVYDLGEKNGQTVWGIASSRDDHPTVKLGSGGIKLNHQRDNNADPERDMVLHDLLQDGRQQGQTSDLTVLSGRPTVGSAQSAGNGRYRVNGGEYTSDLRLYQLDLVG